MTRDTPEQLAMKKGYAQAGMVEASKSLLAAMELAGIENFITGTVTHAGETFVLHFSKVSPELQLMVTHDPASSLSSPTNEAK